MKLFLAAVVAALLVLPARAEEKAAAPAKSGWADFFKNLKNSLAQSAVSSERKKGNRAQGVAAVRGSKQGGSMADPNEPSIKGDSKSAKVKKEMAYDAELEVSIDLLNKGKTEEALKGFESFQASHAKYRAEDVAKAIEGAKAMIAEKNGTAAPVAAKP